MAKSAFIGEQHLCNGAVSHIVYLDGVFARSFAGGEHERWQAHRFAASECGVPWPDVSALEAEIARLRCEALALTSDAILARCQRDGADRERAEFARTNERLANELRSAQQDRDDAESRAARAETVVKAVAKWRESYGPYRDSDFDPLWARVVKAIDAYTAGAPAPAEPSLEDKVVEAAVAWRKDDRWRKALAVFDAVDALLVAREQAPEPAESGAGRAARIRDEIAKAVEDAPAGDTVEVHMAEEPEQVSMCGSSLLPENPFSPSLVAGEWGQVTCTVGGDGDVEIAFPSLRAWFDCRNLDAIRTARPLQESDHGDD